MAEASDEKEIPAAWIGRPLDALVRELFSVSWGKARDWIETGKISVDGKTLRDGRAPVSGARLSLRMNAPRREARPRVEFEVVHLDSQLVVANKPSGISTVPYDEKEKGTLYELLCERLKARKLEIVHRIDKETSGLVVFARTADAAHALAQQFRFHAVHRRYLALAHGQVDDVTYRSVLLADRGDGLRGSARPGFRVAAGEGKTAVTHVSAIEQFADFTLIECRLETGRTHQIRIHLSEAGHPLLGERLYGEKGAGTEAPRLMLHAAELGFQHPASGALCLWKCPVPEEFERFLKVTRGAY